ncbi:MAG: hypothetical protein EBR63_01425 [Actinobacteria bacterium]|nr:hypothetical protein [Actinomycetota bacterium]
MTISTTAVRATRAANTMLSATPPMASRSTKTRYATRLMAANPVRPRKSLEPTLNMGYFCT